MVEWLKPDYILSPSSSQALCPLLLLLVLSLVPDKQKQADAVRNDQPCDSGYRFYGTVRIIPPFLSLFYSCPISFALPSCMYVSLSGEPRRFTVRVNTISAQGTRPVKTALKVPRYFYISNVILTILYSVLLCLSRSAGTFESPWLRAEQTTL